MKKNKLKIIDKLIDKLSKSDENGNVTLFNFISVLSMLAIIVGVATTLMEGMPGTSTIAAALAGASVLLFYFMGHKTKKYNLWSFIMMTFLDVVVMPFAFFSTGGYHSGMPLWLILCLVTLFYLLKGPYLIVCTIITALADMTCIIIQYVKPESVVNFSDEKSFFMDVMFGMFLIGSLLCMFMKIQGHLYEREREVNEAQQKELEAALESRSLFLANMSHEIRTPINTIIGLNEMTLREKDISDEVAENSENIQRASKMLLSLINNVLDLSKMEAGKMELVPVEYRTGDMFSDIVNTNWMRAQSKGLEFRIVISPTLPSVLYGDDSKIRQIISNFLSNAIKYTPEGSVTLSVEGEEIDDNKINVKIDVTDTGMGIRQEDLKKLFTDFRRVNEENTKGIEGTGLGLSICKQLVELMGGKIMVDSIYGKGSTFSCIIPQEIISTEPIGDVSKGTFSKHERQEYEKSFEAPDAKVLVVDDNAMNILVAKKLLRETRVQLDTATSGIEALKYTENTQYDVIFMDHIMPDMDGVQTLEAIRGQTNGCCVHTPVVALTANAMSGASEKYRKLGFNDYLSKPISGALIEKMLVSFLPPDKIEYKKAISPENKEIFKIVNKQRKKKIIITADNSADIPERIINQLGIGIINHYIVKDNVKFKDGKEVFTENVLECLKTGKEVKSVSPSTEEYENFFGNMLEKAENVIHISSASNAYPGYFKAEKASQSFAHVTVVDSGSFSSGVGVMAIEAAKMAIDEAPVAEILKHIEELKNSVSASFVLDSADQLVSAGLLNKFVYRLTKRLKIHIVLELKKGNVVPVRLYFGDIDDVYVKYAEHMFKKYKEVDDSNLYITYSSCSAKVREKIKTTAEEYQHFKRVTEQEVSSAIACYCGAGALGVVFIHK